MKHEIIFAYELIKRKLLVK